MKIVLKEVELHLSQEEAGPVGQLFSKWIEKTPSPQETCLLPAAEIAHQLKMGHEAFRLWLYRDERLQKLAYLRDGSSAPLGSRATKYFRLAEVRQLHINRKKPESLSKNVSPQDIQPETLGETR